MLHRGLFLKQGPAATYAIPLYSTCIARLDRQVYRLKLPNDRDLTKQVKIYVNSIFSG